MPITHWGAMLSFINSLLGGLMAFSDKTTDRTRKLLAAMVTLTQIGTLHTVIMLFTMHEIHI